MPEWLHTSLANGSDPTLTVLAWRIGMAMVLGATVAVVYRWARRGEAVQPTFLTTLVLLATVIAMATQVIGDNVARAFSLVGALSVVRFRTVVKDTQDTAFVIFAVVVGMASGANHLVVALVGMGIVAAASPVLWPRKRSDAWIAAESTLALRITPEDGVQAATEQLLASSTDRCDLISVGTARQGSALDLSYRIRLRAGCLPSALAAELHALKGVESVDLKREA
jgi:Domain of unknown function (DUF4956)